MRTQGLNSHGHQRIRNALPRGQQHVHLAGGRHGVNLRCKVKELVGRVAHCRAHNNDVVSFFLRFDDTLRHSTNALGILKGRTTVLLDD